MALSQHLRLSTLYAHLAPSFSQSSSVALPTSATDVNPLTSLRLDGKVAIVTGAGSQIGIGKATAILFAKAGAKVLCVDWDFEGAQQTAKIIQEFGGSAHPLKADVSSDEDNQKIISTCVERFGTLDIYFANAGLSGSFTPFHQYSSEEFTQLFKVNTLGVFLGIKYASEYLLEKKKGGSLILTASVAGLRSGAGSPAYSATKAAVISLAQTTANELAGTNIRVNAICPGLIHTNMTSIVFEMAKSKGTTNRIGQLNSLKRAGDPVEMAHVALFLASDASSYVNGQAFAADGGLSSSHPVVLRAPLKP